MAKKNFRVRHLCYLIVAILAFRTPAIRASESLGVASPDGKLTLRFHLDDNGVPTYRVIARDETILSDSRLGLALENAANMNRGFRVTAVRRSQDNQVWKTVYGERSTVRDHYHQLEVDLCDAQQSPRQMTIRFRAYDEGVAICYYLSQQDAFETFTISDELTQFSFPDDHVCWPVYSAQGKYEQSRLSAVKPNCERPLVVRAAANRYVAIGESSLVNFARMRLQPDPTAPNSLRAQLGSKVVCTAPTTTPWRFIMVGSSPGELLENNHLLLNLNAPCALDDTSWIRPGKVLREVTLTTTGGKACIDFAAKHGIQFVEFDAGWYGNEYDDVSNATTVTVDPKRSPGPLDLPDIVRYANERGIGILLYVNRRALEKQLDEILPLFQEWGIKGVKYGFVNVGSQRWTAWLHDAVRRAADFRLMVDIHDEYRPTGYERTYPNLMTQEGIGGDETSPSNRQTLTIAFTRMLCGAADNTICYYDGRVTKNASHAYQLAKTVCLYSPWQFIFWYDRPPGSPGSKGGAGGNNNTIGTEPELEFFTHVPTVWDETRVIHGEIGEYAVIARRHGREWYIGAMNDETPRTFDVPLEFLEQGIDYVAHRYRDDSSVDTRTEVRIDRQTVSSRTTLRIDMASRQGEAIRIVPQK